MSLKVSCCLSSFVLLAFFAISSSANAQQSACPPVSNNPLVMADLCSGPPMTGPLPAVLKMNVSKPPRNLQPIAAEAINHMRLVDFPRIGRGDALVYEANRSDFILELDVSNGKQIVVEPLTRADAENTAIAWKQGRTKLDYPETVNQRIVRIRIKPLHQVGTPLLVRGVKIVRYGRTILELAVSFPGRGEQPFEPPMSYPQDPRVMPTSVTMPSLLSKEAQPGFAASQIPGFSMSPMMVQTATTTTADPNHFKFTGKELDDETGLYNYGARYYSPALGRYMSPDWSARPVPIPYADLSNPQTLNLYNYGKNNPTSLRDSNGHCVGDDCKGVGVTVKVDTAPHIITNAKMPDNKYYSGVGGTLSIQITNGKGSPAAGISVTEQNTKGTGTGQLRESPTSVTTSANGTIGDVVMKAGSSSTPVDFTPGKDPLGRTVENLTQYLTTTPITDTSTQTLMFSTTNANGQPCNCQATYDRTLTNTDANGKLNTQNNSQGVNFNITATKPVVTPAPEPEKKQPQ